MAHTDPVTATKSAGTAPPGADAIHAASTSAGDSSNRPGAPSRSESGEQDAEPTPSAEALNLDGLICDIDKSMRYNRRRQAYFERWHRWSMLAIIILGSAAAARFKSAEALFGLAAAFVGAFDLVYSPSIRAAEHAELHRKFSGLLSAIRASGNQTADQIRNWQADRLTIEADEPPTFWAVEADCWNETQRALGRNKEPPNHISFWRRPLKHLIRFEGANFQSRSA